MIFSVELAKRFLDFKVRLVLGIALFWIIRLSSQNWQRCCSCIRDIYANYIEKNPLSNQNQYEIDQPNEKTRLERRS